MSWWNGISTCSGLGVDGCVVWWDGWAVVVAAVAVVATVFLGIATLRLGRQANRLGRVSVRLGRAANRSASLAVRIASQESNARAEQERAQRLLVLLQIRAEVGLAHRILRSTLEGMGRAGAEKQFQMDPGFRSRIRSGVFIQRFQVAESLGERLHHVGHPVAGHLATAMGLIDNWAKIFADPAALAGPPTDDDWDSTRNVVQLAFAHVAKVEAACNAAAIEAGVESESESNSDA